MPLPVCAWTVAVQASQPSSGQRAMLLESGRILNSTGVLEKQPAKSRVLVFHEPVIAKCRHRQAREHFLIGCTFDQCSPGPKTALLGDDGSASRPHSEEPVDHGPCLLFQDFNAVGRDALRLESAPCSDRRMLEQAGPDHFPG